MSKMTVVAFHLEGDEAEMTAGCEMIVRAIGQFAGMRTSQTPVLGSAGAPPSVPSVSNNGGGDKPKHPHPALSRNGAGEGQTGGAGKGQRKAAKRGGSMGGIAARILRYLAESHENGEPDCTVDEVYRISGAGTQASAAQCLVQLKRKGFVQLGSARGDWRISDTGLELVKREKQAPAQVSADA